MFVSLLLICSLITSVTTYDLVREYAGNSFFDDDLWSYFDFMDNLTHGNVIYVDRDTAFQYGLTYVSGQNTAVIRVDNFTTVPFGQNRNSVRITSKHQYSLGSLWIFDALHLPFGCSVWPAWWTKGPLWPNDGEIDIIENINLAQNNQMALHTLPGCFQVSAPGQPSTSGVNNDCSQPSGCLITDTDPRSWGQTFTSVGGGVWATQFDYTGIYIWFWSRSEVPATLLSASPTSPLDISGWGTPTASFLAEGCDISEFFTPQQLVLNIDLCGDWAGVPSIYASSCGSQPPNDLTNPVSSQNPRTPNCYADNVVGSGDRFHDAYFEINHIRAYTTAAMPIQTSVPNIGLAGDHLPTNGVARNSFGFSFLLLATLFHLVWLLS